MTKKLLAIGGRLHGKFVSDIEGRILLMPIPQKLESVSDPVTEPQVETYYRVRIGFDDKRHKYVYFHESIQNVTEELQDFLLTSFIASDAGEE